MKTPNFIFAAIIVLASCNNSQREQKMADLAQKDSLLLVQQKQKDSTISSYLGELNEIQDNLDHIKQREKIIFINSPEMGQPTLAAQIKQLDNWIIMNDRKMYRLQARLKKANTSNDNFEDLVSHLTAALAAKDKEIEGLQEKLSAADDSVRFLTARFNDSIMEINRQRSLVSLLTTQVNTVYYVTGDMKELQGLGVVDKDGGFVGIGRVAEVNPDIDNSMFTRADLTKLKGVGLNGRFRRFITTHPDGSYQIISTNKTDSIAITTPESFWSESKYLVVATK